MGYAIHFGERKFRIDAANVPGAFAALREEEKKGRYGYSSSQVAALAWSFADAMTLLQWPLEIDLDGNVIGIDYEGEYSTGEERMFAAIGPFVTAGSYVTVISEDGAQVRYTFDGERCVVMVPRVEWVPKS